MTYYLICLYLSITMTGIFLWGWNRNISVSFSLVYMLIPFINLGYMRVALAENLTEAILANGLVYLCTGFLQLSYMTYVFSFCRVKMPKVLSGALFVLSSYIGSQALTTHHTGSLYATVEFEQRNGLSFLVKTYGPLHTVYYVMLIVFFILELGVLIYGLHRKDVSKKHVIMLMLIYAINLLTFVGTRLFKSDYEVLAVTYILSQVVLLIMSRRLRVYAISDTAVSAVMQEGRTGFVSFDLSRHYLGSSGPADTYLPEIKGLYIDGPLYKGDERYAEINRWLNEVYRTGKPAEFDTQRGSRSYHITAGYLFIKNKAVCYQLRVEDKTDEHEYIELLQKARQSAEDVSKAKGDFLANMSHEIRTPINAILGMDEMILRESREEQTLGYAEDIRKAGNTLLGLINDVLDFSKIEAGKMDIIPVDYQLSSVINDLSNMIEPRAKAKNLQYILHVDPTTPDCLHGDEIRLKQIIMNILTNAVKYTNEGTVTLTVDHTRGEGYIDLHVSVRDTGIGIKKEDVDKLFIAFQRVDENRNRSVEGTGLGMTITQTLLALMGSQLKVDSEYGVGSEFSFVLRQSIVKETPIGDYSKALENSLSARKKYRESFRAPCAKVLVVDDVEMNLMVFKNLLKKTEMRIDTANSGDAAIKLTTDRRYDLIFLDHRMPNKDGIQTLAEIRADSNGMNFDTPAVCLTANAVSGVRETYIAAGFVEYLTKPIDPHKLEQLIVELLPEDLLETVTDDESDKGGETAGSPDNTGAPAPDPEILSVYLDSIDEMSGLIERLYNERDWENYTIKVHALKSTSRLVGETEIGALAERMEHAGDSGDIDAITENTARLLAMYRAVKDKYPEHFGGTDGESAEDEAEKPMIPDDLLEDAYAAIRDAAENYDYDALCDVLDELATYVVPEEHKQRIADINSAADSVDWGSLKELLKMHNS